MSIIIDLILVAIIVLVVIISAKQGFISAAIWAVGFVAAIIISVAVSEPLANATYDKYIEPAIINTADDKVTLNTDTSVDEVWNTLPDFITENADKFNISKSQFEDIMTNGVNLKTVMKDLSDTMIKPTVVNVLELLYTLILIWLVLFIVKLLAKFLTKLFSFKLAAKLNSILGAILGLPRGVFIAITVCEIIALAISFTKNGIWIFNDANISNTVLFKFFTNII